MNNKQFKIGQEVWTKAFVVNNEPDFQGYIHLKSKYDWHFRLKPEDIVAEISEKPVVPQVAIDYYEQYKDNLLSLSEWFEGLYGRDFLEDFPDGDKLTSWLHDNDYNTNRQRELALVTLIVNGVEAVQVEKQKLYTVEIPNPNRKGNNRFFLQRDLNTGKILLCKGNFNPGKNKNLWLTESEIRKDFEWALRFAKPVE